MTYYLVYGNAPSVNIIQLLIPCSTLSCCCIVGFRRSHVRWMRWKSVSNCCVNSRAWWRVCWPVNSRMFGKSTVDLTACTMLSSRYSSMDANLLTTRYTKFIISANKKGFIYFCSTTFEIKIYQGKPLHREPTLHKHSGLCFHPIANSHSNEKLYHKVCRGVPQ